ncbi:MAG: DUF1343 domain-containing protein [Muribaculaceae bacterium]|nr:DUF1343 domain-containing protein [Muribaculaceae bacterium]
MKAMTISLSILAGALLAACSGSTQSSEESTAREQSVSPSQSYVQSEQIVRPGIEVLASQDFAPLKGKRVGLITNPTGVDNSLRSTIDILNEAPDVRLTALFAPEHGVRGDYVAGAAVANGVDPKTGVKIHSLHGATKKPSAEMLANVDVLVYDIQDIGCRSYTFISTMGLAMEAAARDGKEFIVLDRPNPLGGLKVEGPTVEKGFTSFVSQYPIPYIYGLTPGELARLLNDEGLLRGGVKVNLTVIPMEGWTRSMTFGETGMPWVLPSPHIPSPETALLYPATGIMGELDYVSIGVGYTLPFALTASPWIDAQALTDALTADKIPGVEFRPIHYKPFYAKFKGENLSGVQVYVRDYYEAPLSLIQFYIMQELARLYPGHKPFAAASKSRLDMFDKVCGSNQVRTLFTKAYKVSDMQDFWMKDAESFKSLSQKYYLYK